MADFLVVEWIDWNDCHFRGSSYPAIAEEIKDVASKDPANRKLFVRGLAWETSSQTLCDVSA